MACRQTSVLYADVAGIAQAASILRSGGLVAFPTETVYGLGAHALDARAVRGIFEAKARPADDPLIVHLAEVALLDSVAVTSDLASRLADRFWPGPLTLVLPKRERVPLEVTAGLDTVAVRVPAHLVARRLLLAAALPIAAPSANLFGRPSPTRAAHVLHDLDGRIDAIVDGGPSPVGVESTIVDLTEWPPRLLRAGGLAAEAIEAVLGVHLDVVTTSIPGPQPSAGLLPVHYSPRTPLTLITGRPSAARARLICETAAALAEGKRAGVLALEEDVAALPRDAHLEVVGSWSDPPRSAAHLFEAIRSLDAANLDLLLARELADPSFGLGRALADRLHRASQRVLDAHA
jgi:L-threonylcarbamoyladenylate synthase